MLILRAAKRFFWMLFNLWGVLTLTFFLTYTLPGDPARALAGPQARPADLHRIRTQLGLDRPLFVQYSRFFQRLIHITPPKPSNANSAHASCRALGPVHVDLGMSYQQRQPVLTLIADKIPATLFLALVATLIQLAIGIPAGTLAALLQHTIWDYSLIACSLVGISIPSFLLGITLQYLFAYQLSWLPLDGSGKSFSETLSHAILPGFTLGLFGAAYYSRLVRDEVLTQKAQDYVRTARAKGASMWRISIVHMLRNAVIPLLTVMGLDFGALLGGAIVTEKLFRWPGLGLLSIDAVLNRDGPVIMGTVVVASLGIILVNALVDAAYLFLDRRLSSKD